MGPTAPSGKHSGMSSALRSFAATTPVAKLLGQVCLFLATVGLLSKCLVVVDGPSMEPTLHSGDVTLTVPVTWPWRSPRRGDVVLVQVSWSDSLIVKRIVGLPGDCVPQHLHTTKPLCVAVPADRVFLEGDNPARSSDSRQNGAVETADVRARLIGVAWRARKPGEKS